MIRRNTGRFDRALRLAAGVVLIPVGLLALGGWNGDVVGLATIGMGLVLLATSLTGVCPLYIPFGMTTLTGEQIRTGRQGGADGSEVAAK